MAGDIVTFLAVFLLCGTINSQYCHITTVLSTTTCAKLNSVDCQILDDYSEFLTTTHNNTPCPGVMGSCVANGCDLCDLLGECVQIQEDGCSYIGGVWTVGGLCPSGLCCINKTCNFGMTQDMCSPSVGNFLGNAACSACNDTSACCAPGLCLDIGLGGCTNISILGRSCSDGVCEQTGSCCFEGNCLDTTRGECLGDFNLGMNCSSVNCLRKCCNFMLCRNTTKQQCLSDNGEWDKNGLCKDDTCYNVGTCHLTYEGEYGCMAPTPDSLCTLHNGTFEKNAVCETGSDGACYNYNYSLCAETNRYICLGVLANIELKWEGQGSKCNTSLPLGACCVAGFCFLGVEVSCQLGGGQWRAGAVCDENSLCLQNSFVDLVHGCCFDGLCVDLPIQLCQKGGAEVILNGSCPVNGICPGYIRVVIRNTITIPKNYYLSDGDVEVDKSILVIEGSFNLSSMNFSTTGGSSVTVGDSLNVKESNVAIVGDLIITGNFNINNNYSTLSLDTTTSKVEVGGCLVMSGTLDLKINRKNISSTSNLVVMKYNCRSGSGFAQINFKIDGAGECEDIKTTPEFGTSTFALAFQISDKCTSNVQPTTTSAATSTKDTFTTTITTGTYTEDETKSDVMKIDVCLIAVISCLLLIGIF